VPPSRRRERELARRRYERRVARQQLVQARRRRFLQIGGAVLAVAALIGGLSYLGVDLSGGRSRHPAAARRSSTPTPSARRRPASASGDGCTYLRQSSLPDQRFVGFPPTKGIDHSRPETMTIVTNRGTIAVKLLPASAPCTVNSFAFLAGKGYFDHSPCHRLVTIGFFVLQCGDPTGTGLGGPGYGFASEGLKSASYPAGTVAMAHSSAPDSNGSQFFIVYKDSKSLPRDYTVFGRVTSGLGVVLQVAKGGSNNANAYGDGKPKLKVTIEKLTVSRR
jgi:peptidyl-prolyl cis-trans isomerase B (cyclophilin B)